MINMNTCGPMKLKTTRRAFMRGLAAGACLTPTIGFPAVVKRRRTNELLSHACIGTGNMARADLDGLRSHKDIHITALCDVDADYLTKAKEVCPDARIYRNAFEMFEKEGAALDSVNVSTPDHTHAQYILEALKRGLNVYGQKPLCHKISECRAIEELAAQKRSVTQMGTQIVAWECDRQTADFLKSGKIGEVRHVWLFSTRRGTPKPETYALPLEADPIPETLDWKLWLGPAAYRPYAEKVYHPRTWRKFRDFGSSWLGDLALHLMSPVWIGLDLGATSPRSVRAEVSEDAGWTAAQREQFWPTMSHVTWTFPGIAASGGKSFEVEWCDGFGDRARYLEPRFLPPAFLEDVAAKTPMGCLPPQGRVIEGSEGWILSTHFGVRPYCVMKDGSTPPDVPQPGTAPSHWHQYVDACLAGVPTDSAFSWTARLTETGLIGNAAMLRPDMTLNFNAEKGTLS